VDRSTPSRPVARQVEDPPLLARLRLERLDDDRYLGAPGPDPSHLFGGQLLAQGLLAAARSGDQAQRAQSLSAVFLVAGLGDRPVEYRVERLRDGSSFASCRVLGLQEGEPIVTLTASFHRPEGSPLHQVPRPAWLDAPDGLAAGRYDSPEVDCRDVPPTSSTDALDLGHWFRARGELPDDPAVLDAAMAWASDKGPTRAARQPHVDHPGFARVRTTSLDHHLWFHRPTRVDRWHATALRSSVTADARGLVHGTIHDADGNHVASLTQEVLVRLPSG